VIVIIIITIVLLAVFLESDTAKLVVNSILLAVLGIFALIMNGFITAYNSAARIALMILNQGPPVPYINNPIENEKVILKKDFIMHAKNSDYSIYYKIEKTSRGKLRKVLYLCAVIFLKDKNLNFYSKVITDEITKLETSLKEIKRISKKVIIQFKEIDDLSEDTKKEIADVISYMQSNSYYAQINVGLYNKDRNAYFLYSEKKMPSYHYKDAVGLIKELIK
jgi:hypothetical protein